jgi:hypothetical protein
MMDFMLKWKMMGDSDVIYLVRVLLCSKDDEFLRAYTMFTRLRMQRVGVDGSNIVLVSVDSRGLEC